MRLHCYIKNKLLKTYKTFIITASNIVKKVFKYY